MKKYDELNSYKDIEHRTNSKFAIVEVFVEDCGGLLGYMCISKYEEAFFIPLDKWAECTDNFMYGLLLALAKKCDKDIKDCDGTFDELNYPEQFCRFLLKFKEWAENDPFKYIAFKSNQLNGYGHYSQIKDIYEYPWFTPTTTEDVGKVE